MFGCEGLPDQKERLVEVVVDLPKLPIDSALGSPVSVDELLGYVRLEVPDGDRLTEADLRFARTVVIDTMKSWIWSFDEPDGEPAYATVRQDQDGIGTLSYDSDDYGLSAEQFVVGEYCGCW